jgi:hypothetical protein
VPTTGIGGVVFTGVTTTGVSCGFVAATAGWTKAIEQPDDQRAAQRESDSRAAHPPTVRQRTGTGAATAGTNIRADGGPFGPAVDGDSVVCYDTVKEPYMPFVKWGCPGPFRPPGEADVDVPCSRLIGE